MKRLIDILFAIFGIIVFIPVMFIIGMLILLTNGVPIFFCQDRVGLYGKKFKLYKFRSMTVLKKAEKGTFDAGNKSRVTKVGAFLRKTKLDELPQLFNVLLGQMSIVGPRPEVEKWTKVYPEKWEYVLSVRPGITDNASIEFRNEEEILAQSDNPENCYKHKILPIKLNHYTEYVDNNSVFNDFKIIFKTVLAVFIKR